MGDVGEVLLNMDNNDFDRSFKFGVILEVTGGGARPNNCCRWTDWLRLSFSNRFAAFGSSFTSSMGSFRCFGCVIMNKRLKQNSTGGKINSFFTKID